MRFFIIIVLVLFSTSSFAHHPGHKVEVAAPFPTVNLEIMKDSVDGYNLYIDLKNFNLAPTLVGKENQSNTGYLIHGILKEEIQLHKMHIKDSQNKVGLDMLIRSLRDTSL